MKILLFNEYTSVYGGVDYVVDLQYKYLREKGIDVRIFSFHNEQLLNSSMIRKVSAIYQSLSGKFLLKQLQNTINSFKPDIIHFHNIYQLFRKPLWTKIDPGRAKIILHLHNYYPFCINSFFFRRKEYCTDCLKVNSWIPGLQNKCYNNSFFHSCFASAGRIKPQQWIDSLEKISKLIAVSKYTFEIYVNAGIPGNKIDILPNPVEPVRYRKNKRKDYVLYLGNIRAEKGVGLICKAACENENIRFIIAGDGPDLNKIRNQYSRIKNLEFIGYISGSDKESLLQNSKFLIVPSVCPESFSIVTMEAFAAGVPVLSTGTGAAAEIIREGRTGRVMNNLHLSDHIKNFWNELDKDYESYSDNCRRYAEAFYPDLHIDKLINIYNRIS